MKRKLLAEERCKDTAVSKWLWFKNSNEFVACRGIEQIFATRIKRKCFTLCRMENGEQWRGWYEGRGGGEGAL
jgi:hypothetical protein